MKTRLVDVRARARSRSRVKPTKSCVEAYGREIETLLIPSDEIGRPESHINPIVTDGHRRTGDLGILKF